MNHFTKEVARIMISKLHQSCTKVVKRLVFRAPLFRFWPLIKKEAPLFLQILIYFGEKCSDFSKNGRFTIIPLSESFHFLEKSIGF